MGRPKLEKTPVRAQRMKEIREEKDLSQREFAELIYTDQQSVCRMERNAKRVTDDTCKAIWRAFREYRLEWIKGDDDIKTWNDAVAWVREMSDRKDAEITDRIISIAGLMGWEFRPVADGGNGYAVSVNGVSETVTADELGTIASEVRDFIEFKLIQLFR